MNLRDLLPGEARISHTVPMVMRRRGVESRLVVGDDRGGSGALGLDPALVKAIARGRQWFEDLVSGRAGSLVEIAEAEGVTESYVGRLLPLAFLAPAIVESVLAGTQPVHVTTEMLTKRVDLPIDCREQESLLGFETAPASKAGGLEQSDSQAKPDRLNRAQRRSGPLVALLRMTKRLRLGAAWPPAQNPAKRREFPCGLAPRFDVPRRWCMNRRLEAIRGPGPVGARWATISA